MPHLREEEFQVLLDITLQGERNSNLATGYMTSSNRQTWGYREACRPGAGVIWLLSISGWNFPGLDIPLTPLLLQACPLLPSPHYSLSGPYRSGTRPSPGCSSYLACSLPGILPCLVTLLVPCLCVFTWLFGTLWLFFGKSSVAWKKPWVYNLQLFIFLFPLTVSIWVSSFRQQHICPKVCESHTINFFFIGAKVGTSCFFCFFLSLLSWKLDGFILLLLPVESIICFIAKDNLELLTFPASTY